MKKRFLTILVSLIVTMVSIFIGCSTNKSEFSTMWVLVDVKEEYKEAFINKEITIEDFCWDNVERIEYGSWYEKTSPQSGSLKVYLINPGEWQVLNAVNHFNTLDFVYLAELDYVIHLEGDI